MSKKHPNSKVRIISGKWRGRKIDIADVEDLRPTPDRVRETLFNWLSPDLADALCLDLFAGSGVLGFEALSRGAQQVVAIEKSKVCIDMLLNNKSLLNAPAYQLIHADAVQWLNDNRKKSFDIIFIDPPYRQDKLTECFNLIEQYGILSAAGLVYFEDNKAVAKEQIPQAWTVLREKKAGQIYYYLAQKNEE